MYVLDGINADSSGNVVYLSSRSGGEIADVERINQFGFVTLGQALQKLEPFNQALEIRPGDAFLPTFQAKAALDALLGGNPISPGISRACASRLRDALDSMLTRKFRETDENGASNWRYPKDDDPLINSWEWSAINDRQRDFETVFREELAVAATYKVHPHGIFDTAKLIDEACLTFPADVRWAIPPKAIEDWNAAGRCVAFNLLSASGFHVARAVEATIEVYYQKATGNTGTCNSWNDYLVALEPLAKATATAAAGLLKPSKKVLEEFRQMKSDYRNPIVHPRVVLNETEARILFANGESLIMLMAQDLKDVVPQATALGALGHLMPSLMESAKEANA